MMSKAPPLLLLWGEDSFLIREEALAALGDIKPTEIDAAEWQGGELQDLATPSLFGERRALLVNDCRSLSKEALAEIASYMEAPDPDAPLVLACVVAERGKAPAALLKLAEARGRVRHVAVPAKELEPWLVRRAQAASLDLTAQGARSLVEIVGQDAGELAGAVQQLAAAYAGERVGPAEVRRQFRGLGEQKSWDLCDKAFAKDLPGAIRSLRSIEDNGDEALMVLGAIASRLRDLIRVRALPDRLPPAEVKQRAGLRFDWQARRYQQQARNFSLEELVAIHDRVTETDLALKSGATGDVAMPVLIASIAG